MATKCVIQLSYAIGVSQPLSIFLNTFNSNTVPESKIIDSILKSMDLSPSGIIKHLNLQKPIYSKTAAYGHFGQPHGDDGSFSWENRPY